VFVDPPAERERARAIVDEVRRKRGRIIRTRSLRAFVAGVRAALGTQAADGLIARHGLPAAVEQMAEVSVPLHVLRDASEAAALLVGSPQLGIRLALLTQRGTFGLLEYVVRNAGSLREAIHLGIRYITLVNDLTQATFTERKEEGILEHWIAGEPLCLGRQGNEFFLVCLLQMMWQVSGHTFSPTRAWLAHPAEGDPAPLAAALKTDDVTFGAGTNGLAIADAALDLPISTSDQALLAVLKTQADALVHHRDPARGTIATIREQVRRCLPDGPPALRSVAQALGMSARTLQRTLAQEDTTFNQLLDDVRSRLASAYLADPQLGLGDVALLLGYSETRAFTRAFRRWTGKTPAAYRG
jgi:AraC-like DNA-binding protein